MVSDKSLFISKSLLDVYRVVGSFEISEIGIFSPGRAIYIKAFSIINYFLYLNLIFLMAAEFYFMIDYTMKDD